jgi:pimeloyl-ACP methyl ester carboxylesterase
LNQVTAAGRRIEAQFIQGADAAAPVLVFLHEGLGSAGLWKSFPEELSARTGCSALIYSRYGNGFSQQLSEPRAVDYMHEEARSALPAMLETFDVRRAVLIGHSDGASIALIYAGETGARICAVVAEAPHVFVEDLSVASIAQAKAAYETTDLPARLARYHADAGKTFYGWNDIWLHPDFRAWNIRAAVRGIRVPMLLVQGANDEYGSIAQLEAIREDARASAIDMLYLADCGHSPHRDRAELVTAAVAAFVKSAAS